MNSQAYDVDKFQPTSPVRETTAVYLLFCKHFIISTHVPRAGDDGFTATALVMAVTFQPTSPVRETTHDAGVTVVPGIFQPTSPVRETTGVTSLPFPLPPLISTHVPRAGDDSQRARARGEV